LGKVFYYGSTAILKYKNQPIKIYNIITDIDIGAIGQVTSDLKFSSDLSIDAYTIVNDKIINFTVFDFNKTCNDYSCLQEVSIFKKNNPLYCFFYSPENKRYYNIKNRNFADIKKNIIRYDDPFNLSIEDMIDLSILSGEIKFKISIISEDDISVNKNLDLKSFFYLIERSLTSTHPYYALITLKKFGLLEYFFPFLDDLKGISQDRCLHPEGDVFEHTLYCFKYLKNPSLRLSIGMLLHDYGKALEKYKNGFKEHATLGAKQVKKILKPYGFSENFINEIIYLVEYHMINSYFFRLKDETKDKFFNNDLGHDLLRLYKADTLGSVGKLDVYYDIISNLKKGIFKKSKNSFNIPRDYWIN